MNGDFRDMPEDLLAGIQAQLDNADSASARRADLARRAAGVRGQLGDLLRTIAAEYSSWEQHEIARVVTEAESVRMEHIADAAVAFVDWLNGEAS